MAGELSGRLPHVGALSWSEVADALWLAAVLGEPVVRPTGESAPESGPPEPGPPLPERHPEPGPAPVADPPAPSTGEPQPLTGRRRRPLVGGFARDVHG